MLKPEERLITEDKELPTNEVILTQY